MKALAVLMAVMIVVLSMAVAKLENYRYGTGGGLCRDVPRDFNSHLIVWHLEMPG